MVGVERQVRRMHILIPAVHNREGCCQGNCRRRPAVRGPNAFGGNQACAGPLQSVHCPNGCHVEKDVFQTLNNASKRLGAWLSSYSKDGAYPGFQFKTKNTAEQLMQIGKGENVDRPMPLLRRRWKPRKSRQLARRSWLIVWKTRQMPSSTEPSDQ